MPSDPTPGSSVAEPPRVMAAEQNEVGGQPTRHLNQIELSRRWRISPRTLERWRWLQQGPAYLKIGGRVAYRLQDVEAYEVMQRRDSDVATHHVVRVARA
jgi:hypothetical protein